MYLASFPWLPNVCLLYLLLFTPAPDVAQERTHNALMDGVENFKTSTLKRTDTKEKIVLPNAEGKYWRECRFGGFEFVHALAILSPRFCGFSYI